MSNVKQLRIRIKSIKSTKKITKAMQMVSASKLRKSRLVLENSNLYHMAVENAMHNVLGADQDLSLLAQIALGIKHLSQTKLLLVIGSDRGLCGGFNQSVIRKVRSDIAHLIKDGIAFKMIIVGKKPTQILSAYFKEHIIATYNNAAFKDQNILSIANQILSMLSQTTEIAGCDVYFSKFKNTVTQIPSHLQILPLQISKNERKSHDVVEIEGANIVDNLILMYVIAQIQYALLESRASEEAARTTAMDNATRNAEEMIDKLTLVMNRNRQAMITKELIEIISGAEAV